MAESFRYTSDAHGFTLLEVMTAVLLLGLSYVAVLESFSSSMYRLVKLEQRLESFVRQDMALTEAIKFSGPALVQAPNDGEIFLEGATHQLTIVTSQGGVLQGLQLSTP